MNEDVRKKIDQIVKELSKSLKAGEERASLIYLQARFHIALNREKTAIQRTKEACKNAVRNYLIDRELTDSDSWSYEAIENAIDKAEV